MPPFPRQNRTSTASAPLAWGWMIVGLLAAALVGLPVFFWWAGTRLPPSPPGRAADSPGPAELASDERTTEPRPAPATRAAASHGNAPAPLPSAGRPDPARQTGESIHGPLPAAAAPEFPAVPRPQTSPPAAPASSPASPPAAPTPGHERLTDERSATGRRDRVQRFGGSVDTENAVEAGLAWLAAHQDDDGTWDRFEYQKHCPNESICPGKAYQRTEPSLDAGLTALCLLAFTGAGYTDREGPYRQSVGRAVDALVGLHSGDGGFGPDEGMAGYNTSVACFALAEYYALTGEPRIVPTLRAAITRLVQTQQPHGGWDYLPRTDTGRNDTSITAWAVQALQASAAAGLDVPRQTLVRASLHFSRATDNDGRVWYADAGTGFRVNDQATEPAYRYGSAMTAAGLTCGQLLGWRSDAASAARQRALLTGDPPNVNTMQQRDKTQLHDYYYWYYGTVAMFQFGGEAWQRWNGALRDAMLPLQSREKFADGRRKHSFGSWPPYGQTWGKWGRMGSRVYTTALGVLTLEIYYRHTPAYLVEDVVVSAGDWKDYLKFADERRKLTALRTLNEFRVEIAEPVAVLLLDDPSDAVQVGAARLLADADSPLGLPILERAIKTAESLDRERIQRALARGKAIQSRPVLPGSVRLYDASRRLATLDLAGAYAGEPVSVQRDGRNIGDLKVLQRFGGRSVVVAEVVRLQPGETLKEGDRVIARGQE